MILFASLREEAQQGWVWLHAPTFPPRSIIKITNPETKKSIYCEAAQIDKNFLNFYNQKPRIKITDPTESLVINAWYRLRLGNLKTQTEVALVINQCTCVPWWGKFRACADHPQVVVRVAVWLGIVSVVLGVLGVLPSVIPCVVSVFRP